MNPRRIVAAGALALLSASAASIPHPASAEPGCPDTPIVIASAAKHIVGTDCADLIFAGQTTEIVDALGGDDIVNVSSSTTGNSTVNLGDGDDRLVSHAKATFTVVRGGLGDDLVDLRSPTTASWGHGVEVYGDEGDDDLRIGGGGLVLGGRGDDTITFRPGEVAPFSNQVHAEGGAGSDRIDTRGALIFTQDSPSFSFDRVADGGSGTDTLLTAQLPGGAETVRGGTGTDTALVDGADTVTGVEQKQLKG